MPETINNATDHNNLITLIETVRNMKEGQDNFHLEMKESFKELKENYASRLNKVECAISDVDKIYIAKLEHDKIDANVETRLSRIEKICYMGLGALTALEVIFRFFVK